MKRKIAHLVENDTTVKVYFDNDYQEYSVVLVGCPDATYYTDDKEDALATAKLMLSAEQS